MPIATYNTRTLSSDPKTLELEEELSHVGWDIVGPSEENRRKDENQLILQSGNRFYHKGEEDSSEGGIGFIVHKRHKNNIKQIKIISVRVTYLILKLNSKNDIKLIQAYAQTFNHADEEVECLYDDVSTPRMKFLLTTLS